MRFLYIALIGTIAFLSCNNSQPKQPAANLNKTEAPPSVPKSKLDDAGTQVLMSVINHYYALKDALVASSAPKADSAAAQLGQITDTLATYIQKNKAAANLRVFTDTIATQSKKIATTNDPSTEKQRTAFSTLSSAMFGLLKGAGLKDVAIYRQHCPMAMEDKGADWLSNVAEIKNPYYGKKMLECGDVTDSLK